MSSRTYAIYGIAKQLGASANWVTRHLDPQYQPDADGRYSQKCFNDLRRKRTRHMRVRPIGRCYTVAQAADQLGCDRKKLRELAATPGLEGLRWYRVANNRRVQGVTHKTLLAMKRLLVPVAPPGKVTIDTLYRDTGWARETIILRLQRAQMEPETYRSLHNGTVRDHYDEAVAKAAIGVKPRHIPPAGAYVTAWRMTQLLGRSKHSVRRHLRDPLLAANARPMLDDNGVIRDHYPVTVMTEVERRIQAERQPVTTIT